MTDFEKRELSRKVGLFGLSDLRKLAPIGNLGYVNDWYAPFYGRVDMWFDVELPKMVMGAFEEQRVRMGFTVRGYSSGSCGTVHHSFCPELGLSWSVDSGD